jgi:RNA polymerase sigma-70 factor (ECF subfamily)
MTGALAERVRVTGVPAASPTDLSAARAGDAAAFERLVAPHQRELLAHCYRMLASVHDAEDALQDALLAAWKGLPGFEGRSSLRSWLYRISTNACLRLVERRPKRVLTPDHGPPRTSTDDLGEPVRGPVWVEPWLGDEPVADPAADPVVRQLEREGVELAFVAALQHLPGTQRAVLILREVLGFSAAEVAEMLDTTPASVNSAMQRARQAVDERVPSRTQQAELAQLGEAGVRELVDRFVTAWEHADLPALVALLAADARFTMPPLPAWFDGREAVARFFAERVLATPWRLVRLRANGQPGLACYVRQPGHADFTLGAVNVLSVRAGAITRIDGFVDPAMLAGADVPLRWPGDELRADR